MYTVCKQIYKYLFVKKKIYTFKKNFRQPLLTYGFTNIKFVYNAVIIGGKLYLVLYMYTNCIQNKIR